jgi:methionine-rich copper-binding protein CopC
VRFDSKIRFEPVSLQVSGPWWAGCVEGDPMVHDTVLTQPLRPLTVPGEYRMVYRVFARDSYPVAGTIPLVLLQS